MGTRGCILFILIMITFLSCQKKDSSQVATPTSSTSTLHITVLRVSNYSPYTEVAVNGASVMLYKTSADRLSGSNLIISKITNTSGKVSFSGLIENQYFVKITSTFGALNSDYSTPEGTVSYETVVYP